MLMKATSIPNKQQQGRADFSDRQCLPDKGIVGTSQSINCALPQSIGVGSTSTCCEISATMESPWAPSEYEKHFGSVSPHEGVRAPRGPARSSLGMLIERSTSAPPSSGLTPGAPKFPEHTLVSTANEKNLMEHIPKQYGAGVSENLFSNHAQNNGDVDYSLLLRDKSSLAATSSPYFDHYPSSAGPVTRPHSASGSVGSDGPSSSTEPQNNLGVSFNGQIRSQSAAPATHGSRSKFGPPPGLNLATGQHDFTNIGQQRPASTGGMLMAGSALRPSAKTLMDLIQEDFPNEGASQGHDDTYQQEDATSFRDHSPKQDQDIVYSKTPIMSNQFHRGPDDVYGNHYQQGQLFNEDSYQQILAQEQRPSPPDHQSHGLYNNMRGGGEHQLRMQQVSPQGPVYQQTQQHILMQQQQQQRQSPPQAQILPMDGQQQRVYYSQGDQQRNMHSPQQQQQQQQVQQIITTASGQTVYVSAPVQSQANYGYAAVQYHQGPTGGHQQTQIIQGIVGGNEQYVSVLPVSGNTPQLSYWQQDAQSLTGPTVAMMQGQQIAVQRSGVALDHGLVQSGQQQQFRGGLEAKQGRGGRGGRSSRRPDAKGHAPCTPLLAEFRATKNRDWSIHQIVGYVVEFCQDQNGSRFIQQRLEIRDKEEQQIVVNEVLPAIRRLRNDVFGNYVVQKLLDFGTDEVKAAIRDTLKGEMVQLSFQMYGCRVVQKALEGLADPDLPELLSEFHHNVLSCIHDQNGNHVIQKCIEVVCGRMKRRRSKGEPFQDDLIDFIIRDVLVNATALSCHPYGCRVLQRILEHCDDERKFKILDEVMKCHRRLLDDQYGNYVIQHVLQFGRDVDRDSILGIIVDSGLLGLSRQKFASNVVEKLLKYGNARQRRAIVREMLKKGDDPSVNSHAIPGDQGSSVVLLMVRDAYANYVVQTTLDVVPESEEKRLFLKELNAHAEELRQYTFAKHIVAKLQTMQTT